MKIYFVGLLDKGFTPSAILRRMEYKKQLVQWRKRRERITAMLQAGMKRKEIAKKIGISRQRLSQIEGCK